RPAGGQGVLPVVRAVEGGGAAGPREGRAPHRGDLRAAGRGRLARPGAARGGEGGNPDDELLHLSRAGARAGRRPASGRGGGRPRRRYGQRAGASGGRGSAIGGLFRRPRPVWATGSARAGRAGRAAGGRVVLRDGSKVVIRPVGSADAPLLADGFARLSPES